MNLSDGEQFIVSSLWREERRGFERATVSYLVRRKGRQPDSRGRASQAGLLSVGGTSQELHRLKRHG